MVVLCCMAPCLSDTLGSWGRSLRNGSWQTGKLSGIISNSQERISANAADYEARLVHAAASLALLGENQAFQSFANEFGISIDYLGLSVKKERTPDMNAWPSINGMVDAAVMEGVPVLKSALADLEAIPETWSGAVRLSPEYYPVDENTDVDVGDVLYARACVEAAIGLLHFAKSYDLTFDWVAAKMATEEVTCTIPVVDAAPSMEAEDGWENALCSKEGQLLISGDKLYVRLTPNQGDVFSVEGFAGIGIDFSNVHTDGDGGISISMFEDYDNPGKYQVSVVTNWLAYLMDEPSCPSWNDFFGSGEEYDDDEYEERYARYEESIDKYRSDYALWEAQVRVPYSISENNNSLVIEIDLTGKNFDANELQVDYMASYKRINEWQYDVQGVNFKDVKSRAIEYKVYATQTNFLSKVRDVDMLATSKAWMTRSFGSVLAADAAIVSRPAGGAMHFIEYDPLDVYMIAQARNLTRQALASLDSAQLFDIPSYNGLSIKKNGKRFTSDDKYFSLLPGGGIMNIYLGALFEGRITRDLAPSVIMDKYGDVHVDVNSFVNPTLAGFLPDFKISIWSNLVARSNISVWKESPPHIYTVSFDVQGGFMAGESIRNVTNETAIGGLPLAERIGWSFDGWFTTPVDGGEKVTSEYLVTADIICYARWTVNEYTLTFDANGGSEVTPIVQDYGTAVTAPVAPTKTGYTFTGWQPALPETVPASNATYTAQWTVNRYTVTFDANGGDGGWSRSMDYGAALSAPTVTRPLCTFEGWTPAVAATVPAENVTYTARWSEPCYDVLDEDDVAEEPYEAAKAVTLMGAAYDGNGAVVGVVELKLGKVSKGKSKISGSFTGLDGKKISIKAVTVTGIDGSAPVSVSLAVKGHGTMDVTIGGGKFAGSLGGWHVQSGTVGGNWSKATATVNVVAQSATVPTGTIEKLLPDGEQATVSGGKWSFAKAASVKWAKPKKGAALSESYNEAAGKDLIVDDTKGKTNLSGLKLTYTPKKGTFKGSFKVYALEGAGKATKLKKYTVNVTGVVVDGIGYGVATCKKPVVSWSVTVE